MPPPKYLKKWLQSFLGIGNYLSTFSAKNAEVCESLKKLTSVKTEWTHNSMYQELYYKAKNIFKQDTCMTFYDALKALYLETDASGIGEKWHRLWVRKQSKQHSTAPY